MAIVIGTCLPTIIEADEIAAPPTGKAFYMVLADEASITYAVPAVEIKTVLKHESDYDPVAVGDHGLARGIAQFHKETFDQYESYYHKSTGLHLNYVSGEDQIRLMAWMWKNYSKTKLLWSTYRKYCDKI